MYEEKKNYLQVYKAFQKSISVLRNTINNLEEEKQEYEKLGQRVKSFSRINKKIDGLVGKLFGMIEEKVEVCKSILDGINNIESEVEKNTLLLKYINGYTWERISEIMNYSIRQIYYIHNRALEELKWKSNVLVT